ncbi:diguanylate cyclase domain-containing protein [Anabaena catenula]|uniref:Diguanylate cyclase n=1 Tax=Anabaena catenula FACHB-362 TaxID=2692877 RepID=A0ABR8IWY3_9NOST|nr:diguanylate cyclase [Anabaena catenula]MBD2690576.1 diguanylate cyclase [Anabaena catenula FACHB-362]
MLNLTGFKVNTQIYESANSLVYRAIRESDNQPVILKVLKQDYPTPQELVRYRTEYQITQSFNLPGVPKVYDLQKYQNTLVMILEDFGGESLRIWMQQHKFTIKEFLKIGIATTEILGQIHANNIIHKDINPANIVLNRETVELKIIDFGISTQLTRETTIIKNINLLEGTLAYISPEQTGRMNRDLDYRTDFYSLGATFYELLTNQLPFTRKDILELVHCHLAKQPNSPSQINPEIPQVISNIVMKLMGKTAEERYQNALGIKADLEKCLEQFENSGIISNFEIGKQDISDKFQIPQKLYGREAQIEILLKAFDSASTTSREMILIAGYSGIGKSALVQEIYQPITQKRGYFISGKFDQYQQNIPYIAVVNAFKELVQQLLTESTEKLQIWQTKILEAVGINGRVIIDVIPELELIIGNQPAVLKLGAIETQNRFNFVFQNFIRVFTNLEHPLAIFLDDLQWADSASLKLIQLLMETTDPGLFLIGAYRDNELSLTHSLMLTIEKILQTGAIVKEISILSLDLPIITEFLADALNCSEMRVSSLAELVLVKTGGNPFFMREFVKSLYTECLLEFDSQTLSWKWDLAKIKAQGFTDNVVELMADKIQKLPADTQHLLNLAACIGNQFDLKTLSVSAGKSLAATVDILQIAVAESLVTPLGSREEVALAIILTDYPLPEYKFIHDRIQQAAYSLMSESERINIHYQMGKLLLQEFSPEVIAEKIFVVVNHLNYGVGLITEKIEKDELAKLNLIACRKARASTAYQVAREYGLMGLNLLGSDAWQRQYEITLTLHEISAELASVCGDFEQMNYWVDEVIHHARTPLEKVGVYIVKIHARVAQNQPLEAISIGQLILKQLKVEFPDIPCDQDIQEGIEKINNLIGNRSIEELFYLPSMVDTEKLAIMQVAGSISPPCCIVNSPLFPLVVFLQVSLSIQYGNSPTSAFSYAFYGTCLNIFLQDITTGDSFSRLAYRIASETDGKNVRSETFAVIGFFLQHRKSHLRLMLPINQAGYQEGLETGKLDYVGYNGHGICLNSFWCGQPLMELEKQIWGYRQQLLEFNLLNTASYCSILWETILVLVGNPDQIEISFQKAAAEEKLVSQSLASNDLYRVFAFYLYRAMLRFLVGDIAQASVDAIRARQYIAGVLSEIIEAGLYFYDSLIALATVSKLEVELEVEWQARVEKNQTNLQFWAEHAPMNYLHKWQLVEAEKYRVLGQKVEAMELYDQAIAGAKEHQYIQEEALANELAAKFYLNWGKENIARVYMVEARYCYLHWGATTKIKQLETEYAKLCQSLGSEGYSRGLTSCTTSNSESSNSSGAALDLATVMKSSVAIASEIVLENLLQTLMKIMLENAGAQVGYLLLHKPTASGELGQFSITACSCANAITCSLPKPIDAIPADMTLPESVLNYVARTRYNVVLNNAAMEGNFVRDSYIQSVKPLSVLCYPLLNQGKLVGIVYLENNVTTGAFTADRIELLQLLSGQAAIAIINAQLYAEKAEYTRTLEEKVAERTAELQLVNQELLRIASSDGLTKIANRRRFDEYLADEWQRHLQEQQPLALILTDIDFFKRYNDYYGHQGGDECLIQVAQIIAKVPQRPRDLVARYGGEEFAAILPYTNTEGALMLAESIINAIAFLAIPHPNSEVSPYLTLSLGVASLIPTPETSVENLINNADKALYKAKKEGRNRAIEHIADCR